MEKKHFAGFVSIIGKPNVGKSTLMNALTGERLSIVTSKAQTTRHRIFGIINGEDYQIVYSDTPGKIDPKYQLQKTMMAYVQQAIEDADIIMWVIDVQEEEIDHEILRQLNQLDTPVLVILNKIDLSDQDAVNEKIKDWKQHLKNLVSVIPVSALNNFNTAKPLEEIIALLPQHPPYFDKNQITDRPERFFVSEIIREKILLFYQQEIPYSSEVQVSSFKEEKNIIRIAVEIHVERESQKSILIGKGGAALKKVGTAARKDLEIFFQKKVFLQQFVKVEPDWRQKTDKLSKFGYQ